MFINRWVPATMESPSVLNLDSDLAATATTRIHETLRNLTWAVTVHYLCFLPVLAGVSFGVDFLKTQDYRDFPGFLIDQPPTTFLTGFASWDGAWYTDIARSGYKYDPRQGSHVVFFPLYPCLGWILSRLTGLREEISLLLISHSALIGAIALLRQYVRARFQDWPADKCDFALIALLCLPGSMFMRMAYSESLFLLLVVAGAFGILRRWDPLAVSACFGAASGIRAVGAGLVLLSIYYAWNFTGKSGQPLSRLSRASLSLAVIPVSLWGLIGYMEFLYWQYGDPLLFQSNHIHYDSRSGSPVLEKLWNLITLEPVWSVYIGDSKRHWTTYEPVLNPLFTLRFMNPVFFGLACAMVIVGGCQKLLNRYELLLCAILVGIPYATKGHDGGMLGVSRYMSVVFPAWIVLAHILWQMPADLRAAITGIGFALLAINSAQFAAWYMLF